MNSSKIYLQHITFRIIVVLCSLVLVACQKPPEFNYDFESDETLSNLYWQCGTVFSLSEEHVTSGQKSLKVELHPAPAGSGNIYPGLTFKNFSKNWTRYSSLLFDIYNPEEIPILLNIRIDDLEDPPYADRYNAKLMVEPGENHFALPFEKFMTSGTGRQLELKTIYSVSLFRSSPEKTSTLYFDHFRIE